MGKTSVILLDVKEYLSFQSAATHFNLPHLTTICVNVRDRPTAFGCYLLPNRLRYGDTNGTMLSQIVREMF